MNIGLTGGIATGKSTVSAMLEQRGALIIDADRIAREVVLPGNPVLQQVALQFGADMLAEDGSLNRKKLGAHIFANPDARLQLNAIMHPPIRKLMRERLAQAELAAPDRLIVLDIPLLYESELTSYVTEVVVVYIPEELQLERLMERDKLTLQQARERLKAQMPIENKKQLADWVIDNSGTLEQTERQVDKLWLMKGLK